MPRVEDRAFLTGAGVFTADLSLPGQAHAIVVRSPHAHAELGAIDTAAMPSPSRAFWRSTPRRI